MWEYNQTPSSDELYHFGIKGMRWGVRRYQNKDGSLTKAGEKRYSDKSPYEVRTVDGDVFRVSRGSNRNYNNKKSKVVKTWGEHLREVDNEKLSKQSSKSMKKAKSKINSIKKKAKDNYEKNQSPYSKARKEQKTYLKKSRAVSVGSALVNNYLQKHRTTLNGKPIRVSPGTQKIAQDLLKRQFSKKWNNI